MVLTFINYDIEVRIEGEVLDAPPDVQPLPQPDLKKVETPLPEELEPPKEEAKVETPAL